MLRETLAMMGQDDRLSAQERQWMAKCLLARRLRKSPIPSQMRVSEQRAISRYPSIRSQSPEPDFSWAQSPNSLRFSTPKLSVSAGEVLSPDEFHLTRSATRVDRRTKQLCTAYSDSPYEYEIIDTAFNRLFQRLQDTDGVRITGIGEKEVHQSNVKQYFLECYVNSLTFLSALCSPFRAGHWVDAHLFASAVENVQQVSYDHAFFNKEELATTRNNLIRQKLLCKDQFSLFQVTGQLSEKRFVEI